MNALIADMQKQGLSAGTVAKYMAPVTALFNDAGISPNPADRLVINSKAHPRPPKERERVKDMTRQN